MKVRAVVSLEVDTASTCCLRCRDLPDSTFFRHQGRRKNSDPHAGLKAVMAEVFDCNHGRYEDRRIATGSVSRRWVWVVIVEFLSGQYVDRAGGGFCPNGMPSIGQRSGPPTP